MTFTELKTEFFARGTDYLNEDAAGVVRAERWLNQAYREIVNLHAWPFLKEDAMGTADTGEVSVPDLRRIRFVQDVSQSPAVKLRRTSLEELSDDDEDITETGRPWGYYLDGENIVKSFPLGGTLQVFYFKRLDPLSGSSSPVFREEYHNLIVDKAMIKAYVDSDNFEAAAALRSEFDTGIIAMAEDYMLNSREVRFIEIDPYDG